MQRGKWRLARGGKMRDRKSQKWNSEGEVEASERRANERERGKNGMQRGKRRLVRGRQMREKEAKAQCRVGSGG